MHIPHLSINFSQDRSLKYVLINVWKFFWTLKNLFQTKLNCWKNVLPTTVFFCQFCSYKDNSHTCSITMEPISRPMWPPVFSSFLEFLGFFSNAINIDVVINIPDILTILKVIKVNIFLKIKEKVKHVKLVGSVIKNLMTEYLWSHLCTKTI